jgi:hypothetical protein
MANNSAAYKAMYAKRNRNHGHGADHRYGRAHWSMLVDGKEVKCSIPDGRRQRRGF